MTATLNDAGRNVAVDGLLAGLAGQTCHLYGGTVPADASESAGSPIATGTTGAWEAADGDSGAALAAPFQLTGTAAAGTGTVATYFRLLGASGEVLQGTIGVDLVANNPVVAEGQTVRVAGLSVTMPVGPAQAGALAAPLPALAAGGSGTLASAGSGLIRVPQIVVVGAGAAPSEANWDMDEHLPSGGGAWTLRTSNPWDSRFESGWAEAARESDPGVVVSAAEDPTGDGSGFDQDWGEVPDGQSPTFPYYGVSGSPNEQFHSAIFRFNPGWTNPGNEIKYHTMFADSGGFWMLAFMGSEGSYGVNNASRGGPGGATVGSMALRVLKRSSGDLWSTWDRPGSTTEIPIGVPIKVSCHAVISSPRLRVWLGSTLIIDSDLDGMVEDDGVTGAPLDWGSMVRPFAEFQDGSTWGGGNIVTSPSGNSMRKYHTSIWTR